VFFRKFRIKTPNNWQNPSIIGRKWYWERICLEKNSDHANRWFPNKYFARASRCHLCCECDFYFYSFGCLKLPSSSCLDIHLEANVLPLPLRRLSRTLVTSGGKTVGLGWRIHCGLNARKAIRAKHPDINLANFHTDFSLSIFVQWNFIYFYSVRSHSHSFIRICLPKNVSANIHTYI